MGSDRDRHRRGPRGDRAARPAHGPCSMTERRNGDDVARSAIARIERCVLGALIMGDAGVRELGLDVDDFYKVEHGALFGLLLAMEERGDPIDLTTVAVAVAEGQRARFGGVRYVA